MYNQRRVHLLAPAIAGVLLLLACSPAHATILMFGMDMEFSGGTPPVGSPPWVVVIFDDFDGTGVVDMTVTAPGLTASENLARLHLNIDPLLDPDDLVFSAPTKSRAFTTPTIATETDNFKADGDGFYDILLSFAVGGPPNTFVMGDSITYTISGIPSLEAESFFYYSLDAGGHGPFTSAAHIQNTGGGGFSGWVTDGTGGTIIPEPSTYTLLAIGLVCGAAAAWRRRGGRVAAR